MDLESPLFGRWVNKVIILKLHQQPREQKGFGQQQHDLGQQEEGPKDTKQVSTRLDADFAHNLESTANTNRLVKGMGWKTFRSGS